MNTNRLPDELLPFVPLLNAAYADRLPKRTVTLCYGGKEELRTGDINGTIRRSVERVQTADEREKPGLLIALRMTLQAAELALNSPPPKPKIITPKPKAAKPDAPTPTSRARAKPNARPKQPAGV